MAGRFVQARFLIDYWNIQSGWNDHFRSRGIEPRQMPWRELISAIKQTIGPQLCEDTGFHDRALWQAQGNWPQVRVVAGLTPVSTGADTHRDWFARHLERELGWDVSLYSNPRRPLDTRCRNQACRHEHKTCPECGDQLVHYPEKRVDVDIATDLFRHAAMPEGPEKPDLLVLCSGDTDFVPAVEACQDIGTPIACVAWKGAVSELMGAARFGTTLENTRIARHLPS
ncbi:MAG: NYN domain-containing protein [Thermoleophilia bacterium]|nr:NYN domain-containing protein [Thermoleophilia bacterium]